MSALAPTLQSYFTDYLIGQRAASGCTIIAYRDTFRLLLAHVHERTGILPAKLDIAHVDAEMVAGFLTMLQQERGNSARTRNARLAAIHSLFKHASLRHPEHAELIARVLAIRSKSTHQSMVSYLSEPEVEALLDAPDRSTRAGRRDHTLMLVMITTGVRVSEATSLTWADVCTDAHGAHIAVHGKGRKDRVTPLDPLTAKALSVWRAENPGASLAPVFSPQGGTRRMSTDAVAQRIKLHASVAVADCRSLAGKNVTPHVTRHTCAMRMRAAGLDWITIALYLGHESPESTRPYIHADLELKQRALDRTAPPRTRLGRYRPPDKLLAFLEGL